MTFFFEQLIGIGGVLFSVKYHNVILFFEAERKTLNRILFKDVVSFNDFNNFPQFIEGESCGYSCHSISITFYSGQTPTRKEPCIHKGHSLVKL